MVETKAICILIAALFSAGAARAECTLSSDTAASARPVDATVRADADLLVAMSMMPKLMRIDYKGAAARPACDLGPLAPDDDAYRFWGEDAPGHQRKALPARKGAPVALVVPVVDILKALQAGDGKAAATEGYLLGTVSRSDFTGWIYYTGMPDAATLKRDMAAALAGRLRPIFRNAADGKTELFVGK